MRIFTTFSLLLIIDFLICEVLSDFNEDVQYTAKAIKKFNQMYRRVRRYAIMRNGPTVQKQQNGHGFRGFFSNAVRVFKATFLRLMMNPKLFQGDVVLKQQQAQIIAKQTRFKLLKKGIRVPSFGSSNATRGKRRVKTDLAYKWIGPIPFYVENGISEELIIRSLVEIQKETCIRFKQVNTPNLQTAGLRYFIGKGCSSYVGKISNTEFQEINLGQGCHKKGVVQHETMHALGFFHEQSRIDRDNFVQIAQQNIRPGHENNFHVVDSDDSYDYGIPYDYVSIMHYASLLFSANGQPTTLPREKDYAMSMGAGDKVSFLDYKFLNLHYCRDICRQQIPCKNFGYQDPNNCIACKCPTGFTGQYCETVAGSPAHGCGRPVYQATNQIQEFEAMGARNCLYVISAPPGHRIAFKLVESLISPGFTEYCTIDNCLEVKFLKDKSISGARFCLRDMTMVRISENNYLMLMFNSNQTNNRAKILFKAVNF